MTSPHYDERAGVYYISQEVAAHGDVDLADKLGMEFNGWETVLTAIDLDSVVRYWNGSDDETPDALIISCNDGTGPNTYRGSFEHFDAAYIHHKCTVGGRLPAPSVSYWHQDISTSDNYTARLQKLVSELQNTRPSFYQEYASIDGSKRTATVDPYPGVASIKLQNKVTLVQSATPDTWIIQLGKDYNSVIDIGEEFLTRTPLSDAIAFGLSCKAEDESSSNDQ